MSQSPWTQAVQDRWFFAVLTCAAVAMAWLYSSYAYVLLFSATTVVVTWPLYERVLRRCKGHRAVAAVLTLVLLATVIFVPVGFVLLFALREGLALGEIARTWVNGGGFEAWWMARFAEFNHPEMEAWLNRVLPEDFDLAQTVLGPVQSGLVSVGTTLTSAVPTILSSIVTGFIDGVIFLFAVITLYMEGPRVLAFLAKLSPMDDDYERQLFEVFRELANNLVVGSLVTAAIQGMIATLGYYIAGVDRVIFVGLLTAVFSFFPLVGTAVVWLPVAVYTGATVSVGWGLFVAAWSLLFTGTVDNFVKPLFLRGSSDIHPLLIFLAVFGGLGWMGLPGVLVGPVIVAGFLSLYTMYSQDFVTALSEEE